MSFSINDNNEEEEEGEPDWEKKVKEELDIDEDQIDEEIKAVMEEYKPLVSRPAAAVLVAKNHDVDVTETEIADFKIENLVGGMNSVDLKEKEVIEKSSINQFDGGQVANLTVQDDSGATQISLWDDDAELVNSDRVSVGDHIVLKDGYTKKDVSDYQQSRYGVPAVNTGDSTTLEVSTEDGYEMLIEAE